MALVALTARGSACLIVLRFEAYWSAETANSAMHPKANTPLYGIWRPSFLMRASNESK